MPKTARLATRIEPDLLEQLDAVTGDLPGDRSDHVRQALVDYIDAQARRRRLWTALAAAANVDATLPPFSRPSAPLSIPAEIAAK